MPKSNAQQVRDFHLMAGGDTPSQPTIPPVEILDLRQKLIDEEYAEVTEALSQLRTGKTADLAPLMQELADLLYVTYGAMVTCGVDADAIFAEVHRANMEKANGPRRVDGKLLKPPGWQPPNIRGLLRQMET